MNKLRFLSIAAIITVTAIISSCSYNPDSAKPATPTGTINFQKRFSCDYDVSVVDTADKNGNILTKSSV